MSNLANLKAASTLADLAKILGYTPKGLTYVVYRQPEAAKYTKFKIPKKDGTEREIAAPNAHLKKLQRRLANVLYECRDKIDSENGRKPISHGFRKKLSIITNASSHKHRRYVLNLDLKDFFPSFNFGRVRGFFIHDSNFQLNEKISTILAQIACFENALPQGSPCSPVIADLIGHILDVRMVRLAKKHRLTYSRYADDLTFSTNIRHFPEAAAVQIDESRWLLGPELIAEIGGAGFLINPTKTRMQYRTNRQMVTGLTVNEKVNIRAEYYRNARAMCHSLFKTGTYHRPKSKTENNPEIPATTGPGVLISSRAPLEGILSHICHVKNAADRRSTKDKKISQTSERKLYTRFLTFRHFVALERPLIVCEGKTDAMYLRNAIRYSAQFHPILGKIEAEKFKLEVDFFRYGTQARDYLGLDGGAGDLKTYFLAPRFKQAIEEFTYRPLKHPVILLIDNDDGAKDIFGLLKKNYGLEISWLSPQPYFHIGHNLYLIKTPEVGTSGKSCIENFFPLDVVGTEIEGKKFNLDKQHEAQGEYGKFIFAKKVIEPNASTIDFSGFASLLARIASAIDAYVPPLA